MPERKTKASETLADQFFGNALNTGQAVSMFLINGFQLKGEVLAFDKEAILFKHKDAHQLVLRSAVASMYPLPSPKRDVGEWWAGSQRSTADTE